MFGHIFLYSLSLVAATIDVQFGTNILKVDVFYDTKNVLGNTEEPSKYKP